MSHPVNEGERGSVFPLALGGIIAAIAFAFFAVNYANILRWQIRAQDAADSAAQAMLSLQAHDFNEMTAALYASAIEEYRIRHLLSALELTAHAQGGCTYGSPAALNAIPHGCDTIKRALEPQYTAAVGRYSADIVALHQITATLTFANLKADALSMISAMKHCNNVLGGDCAFSYGTPLLTVRTDTENVQMDANGIAKPYPGNNTGPSGVNQSLLAPIEVEAYVCAVVPSIVPSFFGATFPPFTAVARGAATTAIVEEDWLQPGAIPNPYTSAVYQPTEAFVTPATTDATGHDWYDLDFGGNGYVDVQHLGYTGQITTNEFSAFVPWWNSIPIHPFSGAKTPSEMGCPG